MSFVSGQDWEPVILKKTNTTNKGNTNIKINNDFTMDDEIKPTVNAEELPMPLLAGRSPT